MRRARHVNTQYPAMQLEARQYLKTFYTIGAEYHSSYDWQRGVVFDETVSGTTRLNTVVSRRGEVGQKWWWVGAIGPLVLQSEKLCDGSCYPPTHVCKHWGGQTTVVVAGVRTPPLRAYVALVSLCIHHLNSDDTPYEASRYTGYSTRFRNHINGCSCCFIS